MKETFVKARQTFRGYKLIAIHLCTSFILSIVHMHLVLKYYVITHFHYL